MSMNTLLDLAIEAAASALAVADNFGLDTPSPRIAYEFQLMQWFEAEDPRWDVMPQVMPFEFIGLYDAALHGGQA